MRLNDTVSKPVYYSWVREMLYKAIYLMQCQNFQQLVAIIRLQIEMHSKIEKVVRHFIPHEGNEGRGGGVLFEKLHSCNLTLARQNVCQVWIRKKSDV
jgi:hypothetical protein